MFFLYSRSSDIASSAILPYVDKMAEKIDNYKTGTGVIYALEHDNPPQESVRRWWKKMFDSYEIPVPSVPVFKEGPTATVAGGSPWQAVWYVALNLGERFVVMDHIPRTVAFPVDAAGTRKSIIERNMGSCVARMIGVRGLGWFSFESPIVYHSLGYTHVSLMGEESYFGRMILEQAQQKDGLGKGRPLPPGMITNPDLWKGDTLLKVASFILSPKMSSYDPYDSYSHETDRE